MTRTRQRANPFDMGTPERVIFDRYRKASAEADHAERDAAVLMTEARAKRASAERYAEALRALGQGDKIPGQAQLPNYSGVGGGEA